MGELSSAIDEIRTELATAGPEIFENLATIEKQGSTAGTGSDKPNWSTMVSEWPCRQEVKRETRGAREDFDGGTTQAFSYAFTGPYLSDGLSLIGVIKKGMRLRLTETDTQPEMIFLIDDVAATGIFLTLLAHSPD